MCIIRSLVIMYKLHWMAPTLFTWLPGDDDDDDKELQKYKMYYIIDSALVWLNFSYAYESCAVSMCFISNLWHILYLCFVQELLLKICLQLGSALWEKVQMLAALLWQSLSVTQQLESSLAQHLMTVNSP